MDIIRSVQYLLKNTPLSYEMNFSIFTEIRYRMKYVFLFFMISTGFCQSDLDKTAIEYHTNNREASTMLYMEKDHYKHVMETINFDSIYYTKKNNWIEINALYNKDLPDVVKQVRYFAGKKQLRLVRLENDSIFRGYIDFPAKSKKKERLIKLIKRQNHVLIPFVTKDLDPIFCMKEIGFDF